MQGGGDSDTVSVLSGHQSRPEGEVTGPQAPSQLSMDSEAAKIRKVQPQELTLCRHPRAHAHLGMALLTSGDSAWEYLIQGILQAGMRAVD